MNTSVVLSMDAALEVRRLLADRGVAVGALDAAIADEVPWQHARSVIDAFRAHVDDETIGGADQSAAEIAAQLHRYDVDLHDERTLYTIVATLVLAFNVASNACTSGELSHEQHSGVTVIVTSIGAVLSVLIPETVI